MWHSVRFSTTEKVQGPLDIFRRLVIIFSSCRRGAGHSPAIEWADKGHRQRLVKAHLVFFVPDINQKQEPRRAGLNELLLLVPLQSFHARVDAVLVFRRRV